jgi:hypothetical protein
MCSAHQPAVLTSISYTIRCTERSNTLLPGGLCLPGLQVSYLCHTVNEEDAQSRRNAQLKRNWLQLLQLPLAASPSHEPKTCCAQPRHIRSFPITAQASSAYSTVEHAEHTISWIRSMNRTQPHHAPPAGSDKNWVCSRPTNMRLGDPRTGSQELPMPDPVTKEQ